MALAVGDVALRFDPDREERELREYLGDRFDVQRLWRSEEQVELEFQRAADEDRFYRSSNAYLYNLTAFAISGTKHPYLRELVSHVAPPARVLDYGCGIGSDGLVLLEAGYRVEFAEFDNPSTEYLRWRLAWRGLEAPIHDLDAGVPGGFDLAFAFDVIEHAADPFAFLRELERRARLVEVNFLWPGPRDQLLHHDLPVRALLRDVARHRIHSYGILHRRSHLVIYDSAPAPALARLANRRRLLAERLAARRTRSGSR